MKKFFLLFFIFLFSINCSKSDNPVEINTIDENKSQINVKVDPRMELLAVIQHFTSWANSRHTKFDFSYKNEIDEYFKYSSGHSAVKMSGQLTNSGFSYDAPPTFMLYHNDPPEFKQIISYSNYLINRANGEQMLKDFAEKIRSFATESNFMNFFNLHKDFYDQIENDVKTKIGDTNYIQILENYYGERKNSFNIIPTPLFHTGGYGPQIISVKGKDVYNICGPMFLVDGIPNFGNKENFLYILLHEFSHSFVNPITDNYISEINKSASLFEPIKDMMVKQAYKNWTTCVNEHLVRINVARFALQFDKNNTWIKDEIIKIEIDNGFKYITNLDTLMQKYDNNRNEYKTYESFYPEIINLFNTLAKTTNYYQVISRVEPIIESDKQFKFFQ